MIIGGYAALYHGHARFTEDIDIVLGVDIDEFDEIFKAVGSKFTPRAENPKSFAQKTNVFPILGRQEDVRVGLIFSFLEFERDAIKRALSTSIKGRKVRIIQAEDLIIYKMVAGRARDLEDVKVLFEKNKNELDLQNINSTLQELSKLLGNDEIIKNWNSITFN